MKGLFNLFLLFAFALFLPLIYKFTLSVDKYILNFFREKILKDKNERNGGCD